MPILSQYPPGAGTLQYTTASIPAYMCMFNELEGLWRGRMWAPTGDEHVVPVLSLVGTDITGIVRKLQRF